MSYYYGEIGAGQGLANYYGLGANEDIGTFAESGDAQKAAEYNALQAYWEPDPRLAPILAHSSLQDPDKFPWVVRQFQRNNGLKLDGKLGPNTLAALLAATKSLPASTQSPEEQAATLEFWFLLDDMGQKVEGVVYTDGLKILKGIREIPKPEGPVLPAPRRTIRRAGGSPAQAGIGGGSTTYWILASVGLGYLAWRAADYNKSGKWSWWG